jgi:hypothetical protein
MAGYGEQYGVGQLGEEAGGAYGPDIQNRKPAAGATNVPRAMPIYLEITDADGDLAESSVILKVNGKVAWKNDAAQPGFSVTQAAITDGFYYEVHVVGGLPPHGRTIVEVYADDGTNTVSDSYTFEVGSAIFKLDSDDFDNSTIDLITYAGNGIITEPAGTDIKLDCPNSLDCNWWYPTDLAPKAYFQAESWMRDSRTGVFAVTARASNWVSTDAQTRLGIFIRSDSANWYELCWRDDNDAIRVHRALGAASASIYLSGAVSAPSVAPHIYKIISNARGRDVWVEDPDIGAIKALARQTLFYVSINDGSTWTLHFSEVLAVGDEIVPNDVGVAAVKWNAGAAANCQAYFDYLRFEELRAPAQAELSDEPYETAEIVNPGPKTLLEDAAQLGSAGGPPAHQSTAGGGAGLYLPGQVDQQERSNRRDPRFLLEDSVTKARLLTPNEEVKAIHGRHGLGPLVGLQQPQVYLEDRVKQALVSIATNYNKATTDGAGHNHFTGDRVIKAFLYDTTGELWTTPTDPSFSGYGKDGYEYVAGVQQGGGPHASWATEGSGANRSNRVDFPDRVLVCYVADWNGFTPKEVVIFDLDSFPTQLYMWMRFTFGTSGGAYTMMGRVNQKVGSLWMGNGVLYVGTYEGDYRGGLHIVDFKATDQNCHHLIRSDNHYRWNAVNGIVNRNTTTGLTTSGVSPSLRINPESVYSVHGLADANTTWLALGGEDDPVQVVEIEDSVPTAMHNGTGAQGDANVGATRHVLFDNDGWLWFTANGYLYRNIFDYKEGIIHAPTYSTEGRGYLNRVSLPHEPYAMSQSRRYIYLATDAGVYRVDKSSLELRLAYTVVDGGGIGKTGAAQSGEKIAGTKEKIQHLSTLAVDLTDYVATASYFNGSGTLLRILDEAVVDGRVHPDLDLPGCWFHIMMPVFAP